MNEAQAEQRLAADPAARRLLDQLRALGIAIHDLPPCSLGEDLAAEVLAKAAQRRAASGETRESPAEALDAPRRWERRCFGVSSLAGRWFGCR